jgi:peptidoglycan/LPS O-acetylase OafA/YrhL
VKSAEAFRTDIQALRGLAVLFVLLHHAKLGGLFPVGYLGVDIFFVLSGYLITGIVKRDIETGVFSFSSFFLRRAKRLLPAAYCVFLACAIASLMFLRGPELHDFKLQFIGALTFSANIALWLQTGYFETAAELKPLLHIWSLSIEEQYYMLLPLVMVYVPRRYWKWIVAVALWISLFLFLYFTPVKPSAAFYLLPARAWELALGSLGALALNEGAGRWINRLFWPALGVLLSLPIFFQRIWHPAIVTVIICVATLVVIHRQHPVLNQSPIAKSLAKVGDVSYSIYLVHWPLFAYANNIYVSPVPTWVRGALTLTALILGFVLYFVVERPMRRMVITWSRPKLFIALGASSALLALSLVILEMRMPGADVDFAYLRRANVGLNPTCNTKNTFSPSPMCRSSDRPELLVWGDSFAMHLVPGIKATAHIGLAQATKSLCGPIIDVAVVHATGDYNRAWSESCLQFNRDVLQYLKSTPNIRMVVLSSLFRQYLETNRVLQVVDDTTVQEVDASIDLAESALRKTIESIRAMGKKVVIIALPPTSQFDIGRCAELRARGVVVLGADTESCDVLKENSLALWGRVLQLLARVSASADVDVVRFDPFLCNSTTCASTMNGTLLYRDEGHLSYEGSVEVARRMGLAKQIEQLAR